MYIGDGVFYKKIGLNVVLQTHDGTRYTNTIHLEPEVLSSLLKMLARDGFTVLPYSFDDLDKELTKVLGDVARQYESEFPTTTDSCCPICGQDIDDAHLIVEFDRETNTAVSMGSAPWNAQDWKMLYRCNQCGTHFILCRELLGGISCH
jgi:hypothetical protein